ncbi:hypothetical protein ABW21_db0208256 [Orbilia brochopaga]|nr:hypothetical protein ABW21_db0208256 [Drechslerella brochopaga]
MSRRSQKLYNGNEEVPFSRHAIQHNQSADSLTPTSMETSVPARHRIMETSEKIDVNATRDPMHPRTESSSVRLTKGFESSEAGEANTNNTDPKFSFMAASSIESRPKHGWATSTLAELEYIIDNCPLIDNHAHPLLEKKKSNVIKAFGGNLLQVLSEANSDSLKDVPTTLAYHRALTTLHKGFPNLQSKGVDAWESWKQFRDELNEEQLTKACFNGLQTILLDDGLRCPAGTKDHDVTWHNQFLKSHAKRIVRLETLAEDLIGTNYLFESWQKNFGRAVRDAIKNPDIVAFKTVICYRGGLRMNSVEELIQRDASYSYASLMESNSSRRIEGPLVELAITIFAKEMTKHVAKGHRAKPLQFHTGFGDTDLRLESSDPSLLQGFIEKYPRLPIVLLHASYPFTRQAGYLAMAYSNVYLDFGLIWPKLSQEGQESVVKQVLELTPSGKAMWSTDGAYYGETYYLAIQQSREVLKAVVGEIYSKGNVGSSTLSNIVTDLLFNTANELYNLDLTLTIPPPPDFIADKYKTINTPKAQPVLEDPNPRPDQPMRTTTESEVPGHRGIESLKILRQFLAKHPDIRYIRLNWLDYSAILRTRIVKAKQVVKQLEQNPNGSVIGVAKAALYLLANCVMTPGGSPRGEWRLVPDFTSLRLHPHKHAGEDTYNTATTMCWWEDDDQVRVPICPRNVLANALARADAAGLHDFKIGFEIEFCMFKKADLEEFARLTPITSSHTYSTSRAFHNKALDILEEIDARLSDAGIEIEQFHSEAARGHVIPKPFDGEPGSASHMHISFQPVEKHWSFFTGVLDELSAVSAFTLGSDLSYERLVEGYWAGGVWACWGRQNREAPLRLVEESKAHWEIKCMDGLANAYLAVAAVISAGILGVEEQREIYGETKDDSSTSTQDQRDKNGIKTRMPSSMIQALWALYERNQGTPTKFASSLGPGVAKHLTAVKEAEQKHLFNQWSSDREARRVWAAQWY